MRRPGDLAPVFQTMLEKAMALCGASFGGVWTFDGNRYVAAALHGVPEAYAAFLRGTTALPGPGSAPDRFLRGERSAIHSIDVADEELYRAGDLNAGPWSSWAVRGPPCMFLCAGTKRSSAS